MTESIDTWHSRDLPFLRHMAPLVDVNPFVGAPIKEAMDALGMSADDATAAAKALEDAGYIEMTWLLGGQGGGARVKRLSGAARAAVGMWPSDELAAERLVEAVTAMAANADLDEAERSRWATIRDTLGSVTRDVLVGVATGVITGQMPR